MAGASGSRREVVFETTVAASPEVGDLPGHDQAVRALRGLPGVLEAHVDRHGTWVMLTFDPGITTISALTGALAAHGLRARRMRSLSQGGEPTTGPFE